MPRSKPGRPVLTRRAVGRGGLWLVNAVEVWSSPRAAQLAIAVVRAVLSRLSRPIRLCRGEYLNYCVYPDPAGPIRWSHVFVLNQDWYSPAVRHTARFAGPGGQFALTVRRDEVGRFFVVGPLVVIPDLALLRLEAPGGRGRRLFFTVQAAGRARLRLPGEVAVREAWLDGVRVPIVPRRAARGGEQVLPLSLSGRHRLDLTLG